MADLRRRDERNGGLREVWIKAHLEFDVANQKPMVRGHLLWYGRPRIMATPVSGTKASAI